MRQFKLNGGIRIDAEIKAGERLHEIAAEKAAKKFDKKPSFMGVIEKKSEMKSDFEDLRFADGGELCPQWEPVTEENKEATDET